MQFGWTCNEEESFKIMNKAYDEGINFYDTANVYSRWSDNSYPGKSEEIIGKWLKDTGNRDTLIIATKVRGTMGKDINDLGLSRRHINNQIDASLKRLQTKWVDLYQAHSWDPNTSILDTLQSFNTLIDQRKVNVIGASNFPAFGLMEAMYEAQIHHLVPFMTLQPFYNIAKREPYEAEKEKVCKKYNLGVIPYSPLAAGFLTGKYKKNEPLPDSQRKEGISSRFMNEKGWKILETVEEVAKEQGCTMAQVSLAWILEQETITSPIIGANTLEQLEDNLGVFNVQLNAEQLKRLTEVSNFK
jgi:aryl-alcohol dehydrogenase-like predicted oxidoreductase